MRDVVTQDRTGHNRVVDRAAGVSVLLDFVVVVVFIVVGAVAGGDVVQDGRQGTCRRGGTE